MNRQYDVAAYIWPAYTGQEPRTHMVWPEKNGEWESIRKAKAKFDGHAWPRRPLWGYVDEADPYVMEMEISAAARHGVNVFIYDWYWFDRRPFLEQCLNDGFLKAGNKDQMKFYLMWANHDANVTWDIRLDDVDPIIWLGSIDRAEFERIAKRLIEKYFILENYYCIDRKPVFMIYDLANLMKGLGGINETRDALQWFREEAVRAGLQGLHLQAALYGEDAVNVSGVDGGRGYSQKDVVKALEFDSGTHYQFAHIANVNRDYEEVAADAYREWKRLDETYDIPYFPHVSIGWDNNPRFIKLLENITTGNTPEAFEHALLKAKQFVDAHPYAPPLITINSWNEWTEGSYLEPDDRYGYGYLEAIKKTFLDK